MLTDEERARAMRLAARVEINDDQLLAICENAQWHWEKFRDVRNEIESSLVCEVRDRRGLNPNAPQPYVPRETSASIAQWQRDTFGEARTERDRVRRARESLYAAFDAVTDMDWHGGGPRPNLSRALRAAEELAELIALLATDDSAEKAPEECADISIVLDGIHGAHGTEAAQQKDAKMSINRGRKWQRGGDGHGQHVKEDDNG